MHNQYSILKLVQLEHVRFSPHSKLFCSGKVRELEQELEIPIFVKSG